MKLHFEPQQLVIAERFHFYQRNQAMMNRFQTMWQSYNDCPRHANLAISSTTLFVIDLFVAFEVKVYSNDCNQSRN